MAAEYRESRFNPGDLCRMMLIENAASFLFIYAHAARELRIADTGLSHRQVDGRFERHGWRNADKPLAAPRS
jgi:hypothetical protein